MATKQTVDVVGLKTIDDLPAGDAISDLDTFMVMQGIESARKSNKLTGKQLKDFIESLSVTKIEAGENITISPPSSDGTVTVSMTAKFPFFETSGDKKPIGLGE